MRTFRLLFILGLVVLVPMATVATAQEPAGAPAPSVKTIEILPAKPDITVGQKIKFTAVAKERRLRLRPIHVRPRTRGGIATCN